MDLMTDTLRLYLVFDYRGRPICAYENGQYTEAYEHAQRIDGALASIPAIHDFRAAARGRRAATGPDSRTPSTRTRRRGARGAARS